MRKTDRSKAAGPSPKRVKRFTQAGALLTAQLRGAGARRGFAEIKLLTRWAEICGPDLAACARPVKVGYAREGMGATLTLACSGPRAAEVAMQVETIRARINACYGYNAISRVRLTQEDARSFAEAQAAFRPAPAVPSCDDKPAVAPRTRALTRAVGDDGLRAALETLGANVERQSNARGAAAAAPDPRRSDP